MEPGFIELSQENLEQQHLCCIIRSKAHPGVEAKRQWLHARLAEGHVLRKLDANGCCFIEYAPAETAWVPIQAENYLYIYCLWTAGEYRGQGYGRQLMEECINSARNQGKSGVCMLGAKKQKNWLSDQAFAGKFGFEVADTTPSGYQLLALSFDGHLPRFTDSARAEAIDSMRLTVYYDYQCPFIFQRIARLKDYCQAHAIPADFEEVDSLEKAKTLPCPFNNWAVFFGGRFVTINQLDGKAVEKLISHGG